MSFKRMLDRRLMLMILSPIARALLSLAVGYLAAVGVPANLIDQLAAAVGVVSMVIFNITWELIDRRRYGGGTDVR